MELSHSVLVPYAVEAMFDLIEQAEAYPQFLPWCTGATILERSDDWVAARLDFCYMKARFGFQTRNPKRRPEWLQVRLVEGPFRRFQGDWRLTPLADIGCRVTFDVSCEIAAGVLDRLAAPAIEYVARTMVDAFVKRADSTLAMAGGGSGPPPPASLREAAPPAIPAFPP